MSSELRNILVLVLIFGLIIGVAIALSGSDKQADRLRRLNSGEWVETTPLPNGIPCWERLHRESNDGAPASITVVCAQRDTR